MLSNFFRKSCLVGDNVEKYGGAREVGTYAPKYTASSLGGQWIHNEF
jgi:hypothetical protein